MFWQRQNILYQAHENAYFICDSILEKIKEKERRLLQQN